MAQTRSRRCSPCNVNWPNNDDCRICPECHAPTWHTSDRPDKTIAEARAAIAAKPYSSQAATADTADLPLPSPAYANRLDRYLYLGFSEVDAHTLAATKDRAGFYLYHGRVAEHLAAGCTHAQAVGIYA